MKLNFKPTKIPEYEILDAAGINYPNRIGTKDSSTHYKATKNKVTFRVKKNEYFKLVDNKTTITNEDYFLYIEYKKEILLKEEVKSFEDGFQKANNWATKHLNDEDYLNTLLWDIITERNSNRLKDEEVTTMEKAKSIKFPCFSKYSGKYIYDIMKTDLEHCIAYYVGNLSSNDFNFSSIGVNQLNYNLSTERNKSYNCIKFLLDTLHSNIANNLVSYFKDISIEDTKNIFFSSGKYEGKTIFDVYKENPNYIEWYLQNTNKNIYNVRIFNAISLLKEEF